MRKLTLDYLINQVMSKRVILILVAAFLFRVIYISLFIDPEYDSYDRFLKGIRVLRKPSEISYHWCWLPLFQFIDASLYWLTNSYTSIRVFSTVCGVISSYLLYLLTFEISRSEKAALASITIFSFNPLIFIYDTTGMTESFFTLLILLTVIFIVRRRLLASSIPLALACLVRYEAWFLTPFLYSLIFFNKVTSIKKVIMASIPPFLSISSWIYLNFRRYGDPLHFLHTLENYLKFIQANHVIYAAYLPKTEIMFRYVRDMVAPIWYLIVYMIALTPPIFIVAIIEIYYRLKTSRKDRFLALIPIFYLVLITIPLLLCKSEGWPRYSIPGIPYYILYSALWIEKSSNAKLRKFVIVLSLLLSLIIISASTAANINYTRPILEVSLWLKDHVDEGKVLCTRAPIILLSELSIDKFVYFERRDVGEDFFIKFLRQNEVSYVVSHFGYFSDLCQNLTIVLFTDEGSYIIYKV